MWYKPFFASTFVSSAIEMKESSLTAKDTKTLEQKKSLNEEKTLQVLKNLSLDLQAIHLQVVQQLKGSPSSAEWIQIGVIIDRLLFILYILFISVSFITLIIIWASLYSTSWFISEYDKKCFQLFGFVWNQCITSQRDMKMSYFGD